MIENENNFQRFTIVLNRDKKMSPEAVFLGFYSRIEKYSDEKYVLTDIVLNLEDFKLSEVRYIRIVTQMIKNEYKLLYVGLPDYQISHPEINDLVYNPDKITIDNKFEIIWSDIFNTLNVMIAVNPETNKIKGAFKLPLDYKDSFTVIDDDFYDLESCIFNEWCIDVGYSNPADIQTIYVINSNEKVDNIIYGVYTTMDECKKEILHMIHQHPDKIFQIQIVDLDDEQINAEELKFPSLY